MTKLCPYCNSKVLLKSSKFVYGRRSRNFGKVYVCSEYPHCDAYVGVHKGTYRPKGTLAKSHLRRLRQDVHIMFDPLWNADEVPREKRTKMYAWLSMEMGIHIDECHIGMFTEYDCSIALNVIREAR